MFFLVLPCYTLQCLPLVFFVLVIIINISNQRDIITGHVSNVYIIIFYKQNLYDDYLFIIL